MTIVSDIENVLNEAGFETTRLDETSVRDGSIWECKVGIRPGQKVILPGGSDFPMRDAIEKAFKDVTGLDAEFCFSGWGAELTQSEKNVLDFI